MKNRNGNRNNSEGEGTLKQTGMTKGITSPERNLKRQIYTRTER